MACSSVLHLPLPRELRQTLRLHLVHTDQHLRLLKPPLLLWIGLRPNVSLPNLPFRVSRSPGQTRPRTHVPLDRRMVIPLFLENTRRNLRLLLRRICPRNSRAKIGREAHLNRVPLPTSYIKLRTPPVLRRPGSGRRRRRLKTTTSFEGCSRFVPTPIPRSSIGTSSRLVQGKFSRA